MAETINLDAARAARAEALSEPHTVILGGERFELPARMPAIALEISGRALRGDVDAVLELFRLLLGEQHRRFLELADDLDLAELGERMGELYGVTLGESQASGASSANDGSRLRPTSPATTE